MIRFGYISSLIKKIIQEKVDPILFVLKTKNNFSKIQQNPPFRLHNAKKLSLIISYILKSIIGIEKIYPVGELRRNKELINKLKFIALTSSCFVWDKVKINPYINQLVLVSNTQAKLEVFNIPIVLTVTNKKNSGTAILTLTGSNKHLNLLKRKFSVKDFNFPHHCEEDIYKIFNLSFIEPELREGRGEIELALQNRLPKLIDLGDIKGDLHCHTNETDGVLALEKIVEYAMLRGYEYLAITDHSKNLRITNGLDKKRLFNQINQIDKLNTKLKNFIILKSSECDILENGNLDFPNDVLKKLDLVVCSIHSRFKLSKEKQTDRILRAIDNPYCAILGHPTGRLINSRLPYEVDIDKIMISAKTHGCILELNSQPYRLDLKDEYCIKAKNLGIKISISSDAHSLRGLQFIELGITQARRAGLEAKDVLNTYHLHDMIKLLRKK